MGSQPFCVFYHKPAPLSIEGGIKEGKYYVVPTRRHYPAISDLITVLSCPSQQDKSLCLKNFFKTIKKCM